MHKQYKTDVSSKGYCYIVDKLIKGMVNKNKPNRKMTSNFSYLSNRMVVSSCHLRPEGMLEDCNAVTDGLVGGIALFCLVVVDILKLS